MPRNKKSARNTNACRCPVKTKKKAVKRFLPIRAKATSFATLKDLRNYINCLLRGGSETGCYNYGDSGTGAWSDNTARLDVAMVALPASEMVRKWGQSKLARGKKVRVVMASGRTFVAEVRDKGPVGVIDLNPGALIAAGLPSDSELSTYATWEWI